MRYDVSTQKVYYPVGCESFDMPVVGQVILWSGEVDTADEAMEAAAPLIPEPRELTVLGTNIYGPDIRVRRPREFLGRKLPLWRTVAVHPISPSEGYSSYSSGL